jgi:hypothetical protein
MASHTDDVAQINLLGGIEMLEIVFGEQALNSARTVLHHGKNQFANVTPGHDAPCYRDALLEPFLLRLKLARFRDRMRLMQLRRVMRFWVRVREFLETCRLETGSIVQSGSGLLMKIVREIG